MHFETHQIIAHDIKETINYLKTQTKPKHKQKVPASEQLNCNNK